MFDPAMTHLQMHVAIAFMSFELVKIPAREELLLFEAIFEDQIVAFAVYSSPN